MKVRTLLLLPAFFILTVSAAEPPSDAAGLPAHYATRFTQLGIDIGANDQLVHTVFANAPAVAIKSGKQLPYPDGAIVIMEFAHPALDAQGKPTSENGTPVKADVQRVDVMRRVAGFGAVYAEDRAGNWEFSEYAPDGETLIAPADARSCAACHRKAQDSDFVFRAKRLP